MLFFPVYLMADVHFTNLHCDLKDFWALQEFKKPLGETNVLSYETLKLTKGSKTNSELNRFFSPKKKPSGEKYLRR